MVIVHVTNTVLYPVTPMPLSRHSTLCRTCRRHLLRLQPALQVGSEGRTLVRQFGAEASVSEPGRCPGVGEEQDGVTECGCGTTELLTDRVWVVRTPWEGMTQFSIRGDALILQKTRLGWGGTTRQLWGGGV